MSLPLHFFSKHNTLPSLLFIISCKLHNFINVFHTTWQWLITSEKCGNLTAMYSKQEQLNLYAFFRPSLLHLIYIFFFFFLLNSSLVAQMVKKKNLSAIQETCVLSLGQEDPLEKGMAAHSAILPWEFHGQRSLAGYSLQGHKESDTPEWLTHTHSWFTMLHQSLLYSKAIRLYTYRHSFFPVIFHYCLSQDIEYSSLSYTVGSCSFIPYIIADIC